MQSDGTRLRSGESLPRGGDADVGEEIDDGVFEVLKLGLGAFSSFAPYDVAEAVDQCNADNNQKRPSAENRGAFC